MKRETPICGRHLYNKLIQGLLFQADGLTFVFRHSLRSADQGKLASGNATMKSRPIILFDVMETLVTEPFFTAVPAFFGMTLDELLAAKHPTSWIEFEKGRISEAEYFARFFRDGRPIDGEGLRRCLRESYRWMDGMDLLLADLKAAEYDMHALSNYSLWYRLIEQSLDLSRFLQWTFVSCLMGVRKPDPQAYLGPVSVLGVQPQDCLFIDDRSENIEAAARLGLDAILIRNSAQLRRDLVQRGLLHGEC